jgi:hypothetical protein
MAANPPQPPQAPVAFAPTPAFATDCGIINYNTREGNTMFYKNVRGYYGATDSNNSTLNRKVSRTSWKN